MYDSAAPAFKLLVADRSPACELAGALAYGLAEWKRKPGSSGDVQ